MDGKMCGIETIEADVILSSPHVRIILPLPALCPCCSVVSFKYLIFFLCIVRNYLIVTDLLSKRSFKKALQLKKKDNQY
jgi:hypothetical protein